MMRRCGHTPKLLRFAAPVVVLIAGVLISVADAQAQSPTSVQFAGDAPPMVVPGRATNTVTIQLTASARDEQVRVRFLGSDADGGEVHFNPTSFVLSGREIQGSGTSREVGISADATARGPFNDSGERDAVTVRLEVETRRGEVHVAELTLHLTPEFHLTFNSPDTFFRPGTPRLFVELEKDDVIHTTEFGLFKDTSLPVAGETIRVNGELAWNPARPSSLTQTVQIAGTTFSQGQTSVPIGFHPERFLVTLDGPPPVRVGNKDFYVHSVPSSQEFSISPSGGISVEHPAYAPDHPPPRTTGSAGRLVVQTRNRVEWGISSGFGRTQLDWEIGRTLEIPIFSYPPPSPTREFVLSSEVLTVETTVIQTESGTMRQTITAVEIVDLRQSVGEDDSVISGTTRDGTAVAGDDYTPVSGEKYSFKCSGNSCPVVMTQEWGGGFAADQTVEDSSGLNFFYDLAWVSMTTAGQSGQRHGERPEHFNTIAPPTAEIILRAPVISLIADDEEFVEKSELSLRQGSTRQVRLRVDSRKPLPANAEGLFAASVVMGDASTLAVTPSTFTLTEASPSVELAIAVSQLPWEIWNGWGVLRVEAIKPTPADPNSGWYRSRADPPVRLANDTPARFRVNVHRQATTPVTVRIQGATTPTVVPGKGDKEVTLELAAREEGAAYPDVFEQIRVRFLGSDAVGGEVHFTPSSFVLSGSEITGSGASRTVEISADARARGPLNASNQRDLVTARLEVVTREGDVHVAELVLHLAPEFKLSFNPAGAFVSVHHPDDIETVEFGLFRDTSLPVAGETIRIADDAQWRWSPFFEDREVRVTTDTANIAGVEFTHSRTSTPVRLVPIRSRVTFVVPIPSSRDYSVSLNGDISVEHPEYASYPGLTLSNTGEAGALSLLTLNRTFLGSFVGFVLQAYSERLPSWVPYQLFRRSPYTSEQPRYEWEIGRELRVPIGMTPQPRPAEDLTLYVEKKVAVGTTVVETGTTVVMTEGGTTEIQTTTEVQTLTGIRVLPERRNSFGGDSVTVSVTTRNGLAVAGEDYVAVAGEEHVFNCGGSGCVNLRHYVPSNDIKSLPAPRPGERTHSVRDSSGRNFFADLAYVANHTGDRSSQGDDDHGQGNAVTIAPPTAEILIRAPVISLVAGEDELFAQHGETRRVRLRVGEEKPIPQGQEGLFEATAVMGDGSTLEVSPSTFTLTAARSEVDLMITGGDWDGWGTLRVTPVKPADWREEADPPVRLSDDPTEFRLFASERAPGVRLRIRTFLEGALE